MVMVTLNAPAAWVWNALTDEPILCQWWTPGLRLEPREGGLFEAIWTDEQGTQHLTQGHVVEIIPCRRLRLVWADQDWPQPTEVTFDLTCEENNTELAVHHSGWESLPEGARLAEAHRAGWSKLIEQLKRYLEG